MATAAEEVAMVERLLTRLALTEDEQLEKVLSKLLPYAISLMASANNPTKVKVTEMLSHINKRVKERLSIKLPFGELMKIYRRLDATVLVKNFSLVYIEMAFDRSSSEDQVAAVEGFLAGLSSLPVLHRDAFLRFAVKGLEKASSDQVYDDLASKLKASVSSQDFSIILEFFYQMLLYQPPSQAPQQTNFEQQQQQQQQQQQEQQAQQRTALPEKVPPPGLSLAQAARVCGKTPINSEQLIPRKIGLLNLVAKLELDPQALYPLLLVAACDRNERVSKRGEELLKKKASGASLEDSTLVRRLFSMFLGTLDKNVSADAKVSPAGPIMKARIMNTLTHSVAAANAFPMTLQCIFECLNGTATNNRLKQAGMEFTVWVFKHVSSDQLKVMAPFILTHFIKFLDDPATDSVRRAFAYQAIGQLAQRSPVLFRDDTAMAKRLFLALQTEEATIRFTIQEALNALATSYKDCDSIVAKELENLLLDSVHAAESEIRFCSIFWATRVYSPSHVPSRFLCMLAADDSKLDIREISSEGLKVGQSPPPLKEMMAYICEKKPAILSPSAIGERSLLFPSKVYAAMVSFLMKCYELENQKKETTSPVHELRLLLEHGMAYDGSAELHALCSAGLVTLASEAPKDFGSVYADRIEWLKQFLGNIDVGTREAVSRLLGIATSGLDAVQAWELLQKLVSAFDGTTKTRFEDVHGAICSTGFVLSQCRTGTPQVPEEVQQKTTGALVRLLSSDKPHVGGFAAEALGHAGLRNPLPLALEQPEEGNQTLSTLITSFKALLLSKDTKVVQRTAIAFGHLCFGNPLPELLEEAVTSLFELKRSKVEDVLLAVGEAIAFIWGIIPISADRILQSNFVSLTHSTNFFSDDAAVQDPSARGFQMDDARGSSREKIVKVLLEELIFSSRKEERCAGSVWLLSLVSYCGRDQRIQALLPKIQEAFSYLLGEQNELTQEMASRGMSVVYDLGDDSTREELVKALVSTLSGTAKKKRPIKLMEDSEVFAEGSIGEAPSGGNISTYKELCNLANEMGQPDLVYKFMDLANYQTSLNSRRGAAFGFAKIAKRAGDALEPHLRALVPKLYRYQHDPNKHIQDAMGHIWRSLVAEPKKTIDMFFSDIMDDLIANTGSRFWRARESACLALADIVQGRKYTEVESYLLKLWNMAFRAMDDIKETVRTAGGVLCRAASSLTLRLCDTTLTPEAEARSAMGIVLPFLLSSGITSSVTEIRMMSINLVMKLVKSAGRAIRPQLPELIFCMLESLSSLEDQRLNYAEMHAERLGISTEKLVSARFSLAKDSPMWDTLDFCLRQVDQETLELLVPRLLQLVRAGVGLNTRAGVARFIALLAQQVGADLKPYAGSLIKVLIPTVISEKSSTVRRSFAAACAAVMKFSGDRLFQQQLADIVGFFNSGDKDSRASSGVLLKELSRQANDCLKDHYTVVLPLAFMGRFDEDKSISSDFEEVWEENTSSQTVALQLYMPEVVPLILHGLTTSSWTQKQQSAKAVIKLLEVAADTAEPFAQQLMKCLLNELRGRLWEGKECILEAIAAVCKGCPKAFVGQQEIHPSIIVEEIISSCLRKKSSFRAAAYSSLEKVVEAFKDTDLFKLVAPAVLDEISVKNTTSDAEKSSADEPNKSGIHLEKAFGCLTTALKCSSETTIGELTENIISATVTGLNSSSWQVRLSALQCAQAFAEKCPGVIADAKFQENLIPSILDCITNVKVAQVHLTALECLKVTLSSPSSSGLIAPQTSKLLQTRLRELLAVEKIVNGRMLIADMISLVSSSAAADNDDQQQSMQVD